MPGEGGGDVEFFPAVAGHVTAWAGRAHARFRVDWGRDTHATGGWGFDGRADGLHWPIERFRFERLSDSIGASRMMRPTKEWA